MVSCDGGHHWVGHRVEETGASYWGHHEWTARELVAQGGWFLAASGWGAPKRVRRSRDGIVWEDALARGEGGDTWSGVATENAVVLGQANRGQRSLDGGETWERFSPPGHGKGLFGYGRGTVIVVSLGSEPLVAWSDDDGASWTASPLTGAERRCLDSARAPVDGGGHFLFGSGRGDVCVSGDKGRSWELGAPVPGGGVASFATVGTRIRAYASDGVFETSDGRDWTWLGEAPALAEVTGNETSGHVGLATSVVWVSDDGVSWTEAEHPREGPPLRHLAMGRGRIPEACGR